MENNLWRWVHLGAAQNELERRAIFPMPAGNIMGACVIGFDTQIKSININYALRKNDTVA